MREASSEALAGVLRGEQHGQSLVDRVVAAAREHLDMDVGFLAEFQGHRKVFRSIDGAGATFGFHQGDGLQIDRTYCGRMVERAIPNAITDARRDPRVKGLEITRDAGIGAYIGVPVQLAGGRLYGTLCCLSHQPEPDLRRRDVRFMEVLAHVVAEELAQEEAEDARRRAVAAEVERLLQSRALSVVFQPIMALADGAVAGMEALARFDADPPERPPEQWFAAAWEAGLGLELELQAVRAALEQVDRLPATAYLSLNASPATLCSPEFEAHLSELDGRSVVVEVTEHALVNEFAGLRAAADRLRRHGARLAIDDVGAGYSGLNRMVALGPDVIKLDRFLAHGIDADPARRALAAAAAAFAVQSRTVVVAEGIETEAELETLKSLGIRYGQGFQLARPAPVRPSFGVRSPIPGAGPRERAASNTRR